MNPDVEGAVEVRAIETLPDEWTVDADGNTVGWGPALDTRLRVGGGVTGGALRLHAQTDLLTGQLFGATWDLDPLDERGRDTNDAVSLAGIAPRQLVAGARTPWFDVELGLVTSAWGLGVVANDGAEDPLFGRSDFGDRAIRLRLATAPFARKGSDERFPLFVLVAGDRVVADELASMWAGDVAWQGIAAALYDHEHDRAGVYGVIRDQVSAHGDHTRAHVVDGFVDWGVTAGRTELRLATEGALILGNTDAARTYDAPEGLAVRQGAAAVKTQLTRGPVQLHARAALASGDATTDDDTIGDFRFDRDYDVGMVLFDEVLADIDLATIPLVSDPALGAVPPDGVETLAAEGAFHQAFALQPAAVVAPLPWLELRGGAVFAWSTAPIAQAWYTFRNGGVATNHVGEPTDGRYLGTELDWAIVASAPDTAKLRPGLELQAGHAFPSADLSDVGRVDHVLVVGRFAL